MAKTRAPTASSILRTDHNGVLTMLAASTCAARGFGDGQELAAHVLEIAGILRAEGKGLLDCARLKPVWFYETFAKHLLPRELKIKTDQTLRIDVRMVSVMADSLLAVFGDTPAIRTKIALALDTAEQKLALQSIGSGKKDKRAEAVLKVIPPSMQKINEQAAALIERDLTARAKKTGTAAEDEFMRAELAKRLLKEEGAASENRDTFRDTEREAIDDCIDISDGCASDSIPSLGTESRKAGGRPPKLGPDGERVNPARLGPDGKPYRRTRFKYDDNPVEVRPAGRPRRPGGPTDAREERALRVARAAVRAEMKAAKEKEFLDLPQGVGGEHLEGGGPGASISPTQNMSDLLSDL